MPATPLHHGLTLRSLVWDSPCARSSSFMGEEVISLFFRDVAQVPSLALQLGSVVWSWMQ